MTRAVVTNNVIVSTMTETLDEHDLLLSYRPWLRKTAGNMTQPPLVEDLAQEGWIAIWRAIKTHDERSPLDWWLKRKAIGRMLDVVGRDWQTIKEKQYQFFDFNALDTYDEDNATEHAWLKEALSVELGDVEWAYHHGEIAKIIDQLSSREQEYVKLRFWGGLTYTELTRHFGYEPGGLWRTSRTKLRKDLAHLVTVDA